MKKLKIVFVLLIVIASINIKAQSKQSFDACEVEVIGSGKDLVLIPGAVCSGEVWRTTVQQLKASYTCHIITLAGYASVPAVETTPILPQYKSALIEYMQTQTSKPILMGHSIGGFLALQIAAQEQSLLEKVIVVDALPFLLAANNPAMTEEVAKGIPVEPMVKQYTSMTDGAFKAMQKQVISSMMANEEMQEEVVSWSVASDRKTMAYTMNELMTDDLRDDVAKIEVPVLVLGAWQASYPFSAQQQQALYAGQYKAVKDLTLVMAEDAKHFIMFDAPEWYINQVKHFIQ